VTTPADPRIVFAAFAEAHLARDLEGPAAAHAILTPHFAGPPPSVRVDNPVLLEAVLLWTDLAAGPNDEHQMRVWSQWAIQAGKHELGCIRLTARDAGRLARQAARLHQHLEDRHGPTYPGTARVTMLVAEPEPGLTQATATHVRTLTPAAITPGVWPRALHHLVAAAANLPDRVGEPR
jgi:hypothetical protein